MRDGAPGVRAGEHRDAGIDRLPDGLQPPRVQGPHVRGVARELGFPRGGVFREVLQVDQGGRQRHLALRHQLDGGVVQPGAVLDAVDAGPDQLVHRLLAEAVGGDPGAQLVGAFDRGGGEVGRPQRGQVARVTVDPVPHQLHPAVPRPGLPLDLGQQRLRLDLDRVVADVAGGAGDVPTGADDPRQVGLSVDPVGVDRRAGVPDQQGSGVPVGARLGLGGRTVDAAAGVQPDVAVGVHQTRHDPGPGRHRCCVCDGFGAHQPVHQPEVANVAIGQHHSSQVQPL